MIEIHTKKTARRTRLAYSVLERKPRQIVAAFCPGDLIEFRHAGCRKTFTLPIDAAFRMAIRITVEARRRERKGGKR